jgi:hypothetical protein
MYRQDAAITILCSYTHMLGLTNQLTPWSIVLLEKLSVAQLLKSFLTFYGSKSLLLHSQEPTTGPYFEPDESVPNYYIILLIRLYLCWVIGDDICKILCDRHCVKRLKYKITVYSFSSVCTHVRARAHTHSFICKLFVKIAMCYHKFRNTSNSVASKQKIM